MPFGRGAEPAALVAGSGFPMIYQNGGPNALDVDGTLVKPGETFPELTPAQESYFRSLGVLVSVEPPESC